MDICDSDNSGIGCKSAHTKDNCRHSTASKEVHFKQKRAECRPPVLGKNISAQLMIYNHLQLIQQHDKDQQIIPFVYMDDVHTASSWDTWSHTDTPVNTRHFSLVCHNDKSWWPPDDKFHKIQCDTAECIYVYHKLKVCHKCHHKSEHLQCRDVIQLEEILIIFSLSIIKDSERLNFFNSSL